MRPKAPLWLLALIIVGNVPKCPAQHLYFDTDGDGIASSADVLSTIGPTEVAVYLDTTADADGTPRSCNAYTHAPDGHDALDLFSYDLVFTVKPSTGTVQWGSYTDEIGFAKMTADRQSPRELLVSRRGTDAVAPGRYRLGSVRVTTIAGRPALRFGTSAKLDPAAFTGFGTHCAASSYENTYVLGVDWPDEDERELSTAVDARTVLEVIPPELPARPDATISFSLHDKANVRLAVYDVSGRLVRILLHESNVPVCTRTILWNGRTTGGTRAASGIYFVQLEAGPERLSKRFALVK